MICHRCPFLVRSLHTKTQFITKARPNVIPSDPPPEHSKSNFVTKIQPKIHNPAEQDIEAAIPKKYNFRSEYLMNFRMVEFTKEPNNIYHFTDTLSVVRPYNVDVGIFISKKMREKTLREVLEERRWLIHPGRKKQHIIDCIRSGNILVDGIKVLPETKLKEYDKITITEHRHEDAIPNTQIRQQKPNSKFRIVDKPPGIPTVPDKFHFFNTMQLLLYIEHNMDKLTLFNDLGMCSGLVLLTMQARQCMEVMSRQKNGGVKFTYLARVYGKFSEDRNMLETTYEKFPGTQAKIKHCGYDMTTDSTLLEIEVHNVNQEALRMTLAEFEHPVINDWRNAGALKPCLDDTLGVKFGNYSSLLDGCKHVTEKREKAKAVTVLNKLKKEKTPLEWIVNVKSLNLSKELKEFYNQYLRAVREEVREAQCLRCGVVRLPLPPDVNNPSLHLKSIEMTTGLIESEQTLPWFA